MPLGRPHTRPSRAARTLPSPALATSTLTSSCPVVAAAMAVKGSASTTRRWLGNQTLWPLASPPLSTLRTRPAPRRATTAARALHHQRLHHQPSWQSRREPQRPAGSSDHRSPQTPIRKIRAPAAVPAWPKSNHLTTRGRQFSWHKRNPFLVARPLRHCFFRASKKFFFIDQLFCGFP